MLDYGGNPDDPGHMTEVYMGGEDVRGAGEARSLSVNIEKIMAW